MANRQEALLCFESALERYFELGWDRHGNLYLKSYSKSVAEIETEARIVLSQLGLDLKVLASKSKPGYSVIMVDVY